MIAGPVLFLAVLLLAAAAAYLLRRLESVSALLAAGVSALLAVGLWRLPLNRPVIIAGRPVLLGKPVVIDDLSLVITPASRALVVFLLITAAVTFILAWRTYQGRTFYPFGLALVALWSCVALLQPLLLAPFAVVLAAILSVFLIQAGRPGETRGAWRQLLFPTLSVPLFVIASWYIEQAPLNPDDTTPYRIASWLLIAGFILLLQPAPLHVAIPAVAGQAPPVVAAFLWIGGQAVILFLLQRFLVTYPWLSAAVDSARWLLWLGIFTAVLGGVLTACAETAGPHARLRRGVRLRHPDRGVGSARHGRAADCGLAAADTHIGAADAGHRRRHHPASYGGRSLRAPDGGHLAAAPGRDRPDRRRVRAGGHAVDRAVRLPLDLAAIGC